MNETGEFDYVGGFGFRIYGSSPHGEITIEQGRGGVISKLLLNEREAEALAEAIGVHLAPKPVVKKRDKPRGPIPLATDAEWLAGIKKDPAFVGLDVDSELAKAVAWCNAHKKYPTQRRFVNWLNRAKTYDEYRSRPALRHFAAFRPQIDPALAARLSGCGDTWEEAERPKAVGVRPGVA